MEPKPQKVELESNGTQSNRRRGKFSWLWKIPISIVAIFLFLSLFISLVLIFNFSKTILLKTVVESANKGFNGKIAFEKVHLNLFKGLIIENVIATLDNDTIAFIRKAQVDWDLNPLLKRQVFVKFVEIDGGTVNLVKEIGDTIWNYQKFFKPKEETKAKGKTNLTILFQNVKLKNLNVRLIDKNHSPKDNHFSPSYIDLQNLDVYASAKLDLLNSRYEVDVKNISFYENHSNFTLKSLSTKLFVDTNSIQATSVKILTPKSVLNANVVYHLHNSRIDFNLNDANLTASDLLPFVSLPFGANSVVNISTNGYFDGNLNLESVILLVNSKTKVVLSGQVKLESSIPEVDLNLSKAYFFEEDVRKFLPDIFQGLPIRFNFLSTQGYSVIFKDNSIFLKGNFISSFGNVYSDVRIDSNSILNYSIKFNKLDLQKLLVSLPNTQLYGSSEGSLDLKDFSKLNGFLNLNVVTGSAKIEGLKDFKLTLNSNFINGEAIIDSLKFISFFKDSLEEKQSKVNFTGKVNLSDFKRPKYSGALEFNNFLPRYFFPAGQFVPEQISGKFNFDGIGYDIDNIVLELRGKIEEFAFADRMLFPFSLEVSIDHSDSMQRKIQINSDIIQGSIVGRYSIQSLVKDFAMQFSSITDAFSNKVNKIFKDSNFVEEVEKPIDKRKKKSNQNLKFHNFDFQTEFNINDFSLFAILLNKNTTFSGKVKLRGMATDSISHLKIDTLMVRNFALELENTKINLSNTLVNLEYDIELVDGKFNLKSVNANTKSENRIIFGNSYLDFLDFNLNYSNDILEVETGTSLNSLLGTKLQFKTSFSDSLLHLTFDELGITFQNVFQWNLNKPTDVFANSKFVSLNSLELYRENAENIIVSGKYFFNDSIDFKGKILGIPLNDFHKLFHSEDNSLSNIKSIIGKVDQVDFTITNSLENPSIVFSLSSDSLKVDNFEISNLDINLNFTNSILSGKVELTEKTSSPLKISLLDVPIMFDLKNMQFGVIKSKEFAGFIECEKFNLGLLSPFLSKSVENFQGNARISTKVSGYLPEDLRFHGFVEIFESFFKPVANNLKYSLKGKIQLDGTKFTLDNLSIYNSQEDYRKGFGTISGSIIFSNNRLENIDLFLTSNGIKVLSNASAKAMPQLYGDLIISTNPGFLRFKFEQNQLALEGNVNFLFGKLFMPETTGGETVQESFVKYEISGSKQSDTSEFVSKEQEQKKEETNFKLDLTLRFIQPIELTLDLATIGQIYAIISLEDNTSTLRFYSDPKNNIVLLTGNDLILREGSTLKFIKLFNTEGKINFPTGSIDNPGLNLKAQYTGQSVYNDAVRNFTVTIYITGTKEKPNLRFDYTIDGQSATDDSSKVAQDAIFLLAFGRTKSEIEKGGVGSNFNLSEVSTSGSSALLSKLVSDALSGTGFISSADIFLPPSASAFDRATLKMSGRFLGMTWNFGGTMADLWNNNELSIEVPIGQVLPYNVPNIILQLSRSSSLTQSILRNQKDWEIKLKYGSTW